MDRACRTSAAEARQVRGAPAFAKGSGEVSPKRSARRRIGLRAEKHASGACLTMAAPPSPKASARSRRSARRVGGSGSGSPEAGKGSVGRTAIPRVSGETAPPPIGPPAAHFSELPRHRAGDLTCLRRARWLESNRRDWPAGSRVAHGGRPLFVKRAYPKPYRERASKKWAAGRRAPRGCPQQSRARHCGHSDRSRV